MKRKPILLNRLKKSGNGGKIIIGIAGTHSGAGVTHLAVLLAAYMSEYLNMKTAFLECAPKNEIQYLKKYFFNPKEERDLKGDTFTVHRVTFYEKRNVQGITEIMGEQFECVILDFGTDINRYKGEFFRCDKKIIVSSLAVWKEESLKRFLQNTSHIKNSDQWIFAIPFVQDKIINNTGRDLKRQFLAVPYEPDPFLLSEEVVRFFQKII